MEQFQPTRAAKIKTDAGRLPILYEFHSTLDLPGVLETTVQLLAHYNNYLLSHPKRHNSPEARFMFTLTEVRWLKHTRRFFRVPPVSEQDALHFLHRFIDYVDDYHDGAANITSEEVRDIVLNPHYAASALEHPVWCVLRQWIAQLTHKPCHFTDSWSGYVPHQKCIEAAARCLDYKMRNSVPQLL